MAKYKVMIRYSDGSSEMEDEIFETESEAESYGSYICSCCDQGAEDLYESNSGDYPLEDSISATYEVIMISD